MRKLIVAALCGAATVLAGAAAAEPIDPKLINRIADAEFNHGQIMNLAEHLADQIGGRMTNSPAMRQAEGWTSDEFRSWGLSVRKEPFAFGRGWSIEQSSARMTAPRPLQLHAIPLAWTPGTNGPVSGEVLLAPISSLADFAKWKGKLAGKIVLVSPATAPRDETTPVFVRLSDHDLDQLDSYDQPNFDPAARARFADRRNFAAQLDAFLKAEGALAYARMSRSDGDLVHGEGNGYKVGETPTVPGLEIGAEDYRRLARLTKVGPVKVEVDTRVRYDDSDVNAYDILADLTGRDPKAGYVMAGAHLDSWVAGDGAADNGAGAVVVMEAARILASLHVKPKRTIRFALWAGEEQGLLGSYAYVDHYLAKRPFDPKTDSYATAGSNYPITPLPGYGQLAAYFNLDNGSGKIRGIFTEGNFAVVPIFKDWFAPFASLGATKVVAKSTGSTDHVYFSRIGLPAFQFIQDPLDYESRVHHTNLDTYDHLRAADLKQAAVILASFLMQAADRDQPLPANVTPTQPGDSDPFRADEPARR